MEQHPGVEVDGDTIRITDPKVVRLLAHEERQRVLWALYEGEVLTATAAAGRFGLTASAMSYHLRQLERYGLVHRLDSEDGRERPWAAVARSIDITPAAVGTTARRQRETYLRLYLENVTALLGRASSRTGRSHLAIAALSLTRDEMIAMSEEIGAIVTRYDRLAGADPQTPRDRYDLHLGVTCRRTPDEDGEDASGAVGA